MYKNASPFSHISAHLQDPALTAGTDAELRVHGSVVFFLLPIFVAYSSPHKARPN